MKTKAIRISLFLATLAIASPCLAAKCNVQSTGVAFGVYDSLSPTQLDGTANVSVICNAPVPFTVGLGSGAGTYDQRVMANGPSTLQYNLYKDATRSLIWGDVATNGVARNGSNVNLTVYGRIPARQNIPAGDYVDAITVSVSY